MNTAEANTSSAPIETIGRYEVYSEIASGGMASVCFGRQLGHVGFARTVAIKRLHPHVAREPDFVQMFLDEARLATRISNAHVVQTLDVVASGGELLLVMEYVHGEALSKLLTTTAKRGERVDPRIAVMIATNIFEGLHAAHEARTERGVPLEIVHRDVSPQNVLVGVDGVARVFDFGIAKAADRLHTTQDGSLKGKLAYMSPEQLENTDVDRRTDVWAASVVLWEMLAGRRLFVADSQAALVRVVLTREIPSLTTFGLSKKLDAVLQRGLARDPDQRFSTAREMGLALEEALAPAPTRVVGQWVERNATNELRQRAEVLEQVGGDAAARRPSGATKVEVAALIGSSDDENETLAAGGSGSAAIVDEDETTLSKNGQHKRIVPGMMRDETFAMPNAPVVPHPADEADETLARDLLHHPSVKSTLVDPMHGYGSGAASSSPIMMTPSQPMSVRSTVAMSHLPAHQSFTNPRDALTSPSMNRRQKPPVQTFVEETLSRMRSSQAAMTIGIAGAIAAGILLLMLTVMLGRRPPQPPQDSNATQPAATDPPPTPVPMPAITSTFAANTNSVAVLPPPPPPPTTPPDPSLTPAPPPTPTPTPTAVHTNPKPQPQPHPHPPPTNAKTTPSAAAPKKCTPFDFDYPACLKK